MFFFLSGQSETVIALESNKNPGCLIFCEGITFDFELMSKPNRLSNELA